MKTHNNKYTTSRLTICVVGSFVMAILSGLVLSSSFVSADDVVDIINITVPVSCTISGTGMNTHNAEIQNGTYQANIGTTTLHAFCNDNNGFAIYAAGYTGDEIGETNSNKLVGTSASSNATIDTGLATSAGNPDVSNWAMKLAITQDSGDTTSTNAFTIDSAPNTSGGADASFSQYHTVPNEYVKVAHKNSGTDMTASTGGVKLTTTYAAYISKTQPADTYSGQVIYTLVHPSSAAPVLPGTVAVNYNGNGKTFTGGEGVNKVVYAKSPMYIATTPQIVKSSNVNSDGMQNGAYTNNEAVLTPITVIGASKMKIEMQYGISSGTLVGVTQGEWNGDSSALPGDHEVITEQSSGNATFVFEGDTVTVGIMNTSGTSPTEGYDYGFYARVYPIYATEQEGTEPSDEFASLTTDTGTYATTTDWYGSWYADINNTHYDFLDETGVKDFLKSNIVTLSGTTIDLYRGLTFDEAYTRADKTQDNGHYKQQELTKSMCNTIAITQNETLKDVRDNNTYMVGKLKDGNCWMLDNLALDPTDPTTAANMNASNTNATQEAITNLLNGGSSATGWSNTAVANVTTNFKNDDSYVQPRINNASKDTLVTSYGPASTNGQAKVGIYYNYCAASASTYCYASGQGIDAPDTIIDAEQDICPANWRMPTGGNTGEYFKLAQKYGNDATNTNSLQYNLSTPLSGYDNGNAANGQGWIGYWWSSTYRNSDTMYGLYVTPTNAYPGNSSGRSSGLSVRCLMTE
ncbi:hypothetical protein IKF32_00790 [Candidatus Saccharibacteria bacterium]|nr:hypothetical protein [Candidatus Saccharibacteria bacterium]